MSRICVPALAALAGLALAGCATVPKQKPPQEVRLIHGGRSEYAIVVARDAPAPLRYAAEELQRFLKEMTGAELPIQDDAGPLGPHEIILGDNAHLHQLGIEIDVKNLGAEGYVLQTEGPRLIIAGGPPRGVLYGVYGLLEDHLGCRWFTPEVSRIPRKRSIVLPALNEIRRPVLEYREPFVYDCFDGDWCARNRVNSSRGVFQERHGGHVRFGNGMFVHTFNVLMPPEQYFDAHPEYYAEVGGRRLKEQTQLCCTNEDVVRICTEEMHKRILADPDAYVFSLSQNDWGNYCECAKCRALAEAEGSQMAPVLQLVNRVAETIEKEFPDKAIETLAYQWTRKPPRTIRPRPNVIIRLCSIECCFMHPLATCDAPDNQAFREDANAWAHAANRLWVWDYVTSFRHFLVPFPNQRILAENVRFFVEHNVTGLFEQDNYISPNGEFSPLGGYMLAKFLWNPGYDENAALDEFLEGVYGKAAKPIRAYINQLHAEVTENNIHAGIGTGPSDALYLTDAVLARACRLWDKAEKAVAGSPETLERVRFARLPVEYVWLEQHKAGSYEFDHTAFRMRLAPELAERAHRFIAVARRAGIMWMNEGQTSLDAYEKDLQGLLQKGWKALTPREPMDPGAAAPGVAFRCYEGRWGRLPDVAALTPAARGVVKEPGPGCAGRKTDFALEFSGYVRAPHDGVYCFYLRSNDGSRMRIGPDVIVDNDGEHGSVEKSGVAALRTGWHPFTVSYFQTGASMDLKLQWEGPGFGKQPMPPDAFRHQPEG